jgi:hypothetical protein
MNVAHGTPREFKFPGTIQRKTRLSCREYDWEEPIACRIGRTNRSFVLPFDKAQRVNRIPIENPKSKIQNESLLPLDIIGGNE